MEFGILSPEVPVSGSSAGAGMAAELFCKTREYGFDLMQFNYTSVGLEEMPLIIADSLNREIAAGAAKNRIGIAAVSGTFNMAHPDIAVRQDGVKRFKQIASSCRALGCDLVSLCTGSRNMESMWRPHPDNETPEAWKDMASVMEQLVLIAEKFSINLGIETEASNIINTPQKAKKIIDEINSPRLKIIMDAANLFRHGMAKKENVKKVMAEAFDILGPYIALAHGKDILDLGPPEVSQPDVSLSDKSPSGQNQQPREGIAFTCAGKGIIDFAFFMNELEKIGYKNGLILHGIKNPKDIPGCLEYIRGISR